VNVVGGKGRRGKKGGGGKDRSPTRRDTCASAPGTALYLSGMDVRTVIAAGCQAYEQVGIKRGGEREKKGKKIRTCEIEHAPEGDWQ